MGCNASREISYLAAAPQGSSPGQIVSVMVNGNSVFVAIPNGVKAGELFRFTATDIVNGGGSQPGNPPPPAVHVNTNVSIGTMYQSPLPDGQFRVIVPTGISPGEEFEILSPSGGGRLRLVCPPNTYTGMTFIAQDPASRPINNYSTPPSSYSSQSNVSATPHSITSPPAVAVPLNDDNGYYSSKQSMEVAKEASAPNNSYYAPPQPTSPPQPAIVTTPLSSPSHNGTTTSLKVSTTPTNGSQTPSQFTNDSSGSPKGPPPGQMDIVVPAGVLPGQVFEVICSGTRIGIKCPPSTQPGQKIRIQIPESKKDIPSAPRMSMESSLPSPPPTAAAGPKTHQITVPNGVYPGQNFEVQIDNKKVTIQCPPGVTSGQVIQINL